MLERRALIRAPSDRLEVAHQASEMPHRAHGSRRLGLHSGLFDNGTGYIEASARLALHDLLDPSAGYPRLSGLEFLPTRVRYDLAERAFTLRELSLFTFTHLVPVGRFQKNMSWRVKAGFSRTSNDCNCGQGGIVGGPGITLATGSEKFAVFGFFDTAANITPDLKDRLGVFRIGGGPTVGARLQLGPATAFAVGNWHYFPRQEQEQELRVQGTIRVPLGERFSADVFGQSIFRDWRAGLSVFSYF